MLFKQITSKREPYQTRWQSTLKNHFDKKFIHFDIFQAVVDSERHIQHRDEAELCTNCDKIQQSHQVEKNSK